ncbi:MAG: hypothetical protein M1821_009469 [Bathelium mastoideum]|nr:MAG: hypothetical protein M1821_009469 [Bathelium mastoideum]
MSFGYGVPDLIFLNKLLIRVYDAFFHKYNNAPRQLRRFRDKLDRCSDSFKAQDESHLGQQYPGKEAFEDALEECREFINSRQSVMLRKNGTATKESMVGMFQTGKFAFERDYLESLSRELAQHQNDFTNFKVDLKLDRILQLIKTVLYFLQHTPAGNELSRTNGTIGESRSIGEGGEHAELHANIYRAIDSLNDLLSSEEGHNEQISGFKHMAVVDRGSKPAGRSEDFPDMKESFGPASSNDAKLSNVPNDTLLPTHASRQPLPSSSHPCEVTINIREIQLCATSYYIDSGPDIRYRKLVWLDSRQTSVFEHKVPYKCHPYTHHGLAERALEVSFLDDQHLTVSPTVEGLLLGNPTYRFHVLSEYKHFQSSIRQRILLDEYDVDKITMKHTQSYKVTYNQRIQLWYSSDKSSQAYLSFFARPYTKLKNYEMPLRWFQRTVEAPSKRMSVKISFALEPKDHCQKLFSNIDCRSGEKGFATAFFRKRNLTPTTLSANSLPVKHRYAPKEWIDKFGFIKFVFGNISDRNKFIKAFDSAHASSTASITTATPPP